MVGLRIVTRLMARGPGFVVRFLSYVACVVALGLLLFATAPNIGVAIAANAVVEGSFFLLIPGIYAVLSLAVPAKVRAFGFAVGTLWILPGLLLLPVVGSLADTYGIRWGLIAAVPVFLVGAFVLASGHTFVEHDIQQVWRSAAARSRWRCCAGRARSSCCSAGTSTSTTTTCRCSSA